MIKGKKSGKSLDEIGERWYSFSLKSEKIIYCYLCCNRHRVKKKTLRNLDEKLKFETYQQWNQYVCNKYQNYNINELIEFSRYLNQMIRNIKPNHEYLSIMASAVIAAIFTKMFDLLYQYNGFSNIPFWSAFLGILLLYIFLMLLIFFLIFQVMSPLFDKHFEEDFFKDYKEIIDSLIDVKMK
ncbi:MAG: hypothetical protein HDR04_19770 [Lachnospiraceae bacterium]|nr:hypothetical protein [Lachnospiraceae bacterium]